MNQEQYDRVTGAVDFRNERPGEEEMPVEGIDFDKISAYIIIIIIHSSLYGES